MEPLTRLLNRNLGSVTYIWYYPVPYTVSPGQLGSLVFQAKIVYVFTIYPTRVTCPT